MQIIFYRHRGQLFDRLIRWWTGSDYSHCEAVVSMPQPSVRSPTGLGPRDRVAGLFDGEVTMISSSPRDGGVREITLVLVPDHWDVLEVELCSLAPGGPGGRSDAEGARRLAEGVSSGRSDAEEARRLAEVIAFMRARIGRKYDWAGIVFSQILPRAVHAEDRWFCSELIAAALGFELANKYSPGRLYEALSARGGARILLPQPSVQSPSPGGRSDA